MPVNFASNQEIETWNKLILSNPDGGNVAQSIELATLKLQNNWKIKFIIANRIAITVHERLIPCFGKFWYIPKGPGINTVDEIAKLINPIREFAKQQNVFMIKLEPEIIKNDINVKKLSKLPIIKNNPIQPNSSTVVLNITKDTDKLMTSLPQKSRHAIKRAYRDGVETKIAEPNDKNLEIMADLINQTMANKSIAIRDSSYYKKFWKLYIDNGLGTLFFAYFEGQPVAGAFVITFGQKATYKDGGSVRQRTAYGASHALQWHIIQWLSNKGITSYDLCGAPPADEINNKNHPHYGIGLFKTSFNKTITEFVGAYDIAVKPLAYKIWLKLGERVVHRIYSVILKKMFY